MAKKNPVYERINDESETLEPVSVAEIENALGAEASGSTDISGSPFSLWTLRLKLLSEIVSTGGRPGRREASIRKISMTDAEWAALDEVTRVLKRQGVNATPGQVAGLLLHHSLTEVSRRLERIVPAEKTSSQSSKSATEKNLEETLESVLAAAASAEGHLEQLRPVALELLRRMRDEKGRTQNDDEF